MEFLQPVTGVFTKEDMIQVWTHKWVGLDPPTLGVTRSSVFRQETKNIYPQHIEPQNQFSTLKKKVHNTEMLHKQISLAGLFITAHTQGNVLQSSGSHHSYEQEFYDDPTLSLKIKMRVG